jgi:hypothetical protein
MVLSSGFFSLREKTNNDYHYATEMLSRRGFSFVVGIGGLIGMTSNPKQNNTDEALREASKTNRRVAALVFAALISQAA